MIEAKVQLKEAETRLKDSNELNKLNPVSLLTQMIENKVYLWNNV